MLVRVCVYGVLLYVGLLTLGVSGFIGPVTFELYRPPGPAASEAYYGGLV